MMLDGPPPNPQWGPGASRCMNRKVAMLHHAKRFVPLGLTLLGIGLFLGLLLQVGLRAVFAELAPLRWWLPVICLPYLLVTLLDTAGWHHSFLPQTSVPLFGHLVAARLGGEAINLLTPFASVGGEPAKAALLRPHGVPFTDGLASVLIQKTIMTLAEAAFILGGVLLVPFLGFSKVEVATGVSGALLLLAGTGGLLVLQRRGLFRLSVGLLKRLKTGWGQISTAEMTALDQAVSDYYASGRARLRSFSLFLAGWLAGVAETALFLWLLGRPVPLETAVAIEALVQAARAIGFLIPASLGAQEGGTVLIFLAFRLGGESALAYSLLRRFREICFILTGLLILVRAGWIPGHAGQRGSPEAGRKDQ